MDSSDNDDSANLDNRLGTCEVCNLNNAKYSCPKCEIKSCNLKCLVLHKTELSCDGVRDRTKYVPINKMTKSDLMNDYYFLEECTKFVNEKKANKRVKNNRTLSTKQYRLQSEARLRKTSLKFLLPMFKKSEANTTFFDEISKKIYWKIEWHFPNAENITYIDEKCNENDKLYVLLNKYLDSYSTIDIPMKNRLEFYQSRGINNLKILLQSEGVIRCKNRFFELDHKETLKRNLEGKTIIEHPIIYVVFGDSIKGFDVIDSDEDVEAEAKIYEEEINNLHKSNQNQSKGDKRSSLLSTRMNQHMENLKIKSEPMPKKIKKEIESCSKNLLFTNDSDDSGNTTEEELTTLKLKVEVE